MKQGGWSKRDIFSSTSQTAHLLLCFPQRWYVKDFFLPPMPRPRIKLMSVQLHLFWGTFIQDALPTELPRLRLGVKDTGRCPNVILVWWYPTASRKKAWGKISQSLSPYEIIFNISHFVFAYMKLKFLGVVSVHISYLYMEFLWKVKIHWVVGWEFLDNLSNV